MPVTDVTALALNRLGWKITDGASWNRAIEDFQRGYALPGQPALLVDGKAGPKTRRAVVLSDERRKAGQGTASEHFSYAEWRCSCGGRLAGCRLVVVQRDLLIGLEGYRAAYSPGGVEVVSGYRCPAQNAAVGGATDSQHLYGGAADVTYAATDIAVRRLRRFSGIGRARSTHKVRHVDVRHVTGHNRSGGTPDAPTTWDYAA